MKVFSDSARARILGEESKLQKPIFENPYFPETKDLSSI
jgi:hypothetical protein